jgi:hypothetical protein
MKSKEEDLTTKSNTSSTFVAIGQTRIRKKKIEGEERKERGKTPYFLANLNSCLHSFNWRKQSSNVWKEKNKWAKIEGCGKGRKKGK